MYATLGIRSLAGGNWKTLQPSNLLMPTMSQVTTISHIENIIVEGNGSVASWRGQEPNESEPDSVFIFIIVIATISFASFASIVVIFVNHHRQINRENLRRTISYISGHKCMAQTRNRTTHVYSHVIDPLSIISIEQTEFLLRVSGSPPLYRVALNSPCSPCVEDLPCEDGDVDK